LAEWGVECRKSGIGEEGEDHYELMGVKCDAIMGKDKVSEGHEELGESSGSGKT